MTLAAWFARVVGLRIAAATLALAAVLQFTDLFETAPRLLDEGRGAAGLGVYAALRAPDLLVQAAPIGVLAGALFGFGRLARDEAVTVLRSVGVSAYRLVLIAAPVTVAFAGLLFVLAAWAAPRSDTALAAWLERGAPAPAVGTAPPRRSFRLGSDVVTASRGDDAGTRLVDVDVYARGPDGRMVRRLSARGATRGPDGRWRLRDVRWEDYGRPGSPAPVAAGRAAEVAWTDRLDPQDVRALWRQDAAVPPAAAERALRGGAAPLPLSAYREQLARLSALPAGLVVMLLIAAPTALGRSRDGGVTQLMLAGLAAGLGFLVVDGLAGALGSAGLVPSTAAAWAAPLLFTLGALVALLHLEG